MGSVSVIAVIPARGGSKGIPRKNMRLINGKPLISYAITNAQRCSLIDHIVVTSDCEEILAYARNCGVEALARSADLAEDHVPLDPVVHDAVLRMEEANGRYEIVVTLQPTSPLLSPESLSSALQEFSVSDADTMISAVNRPHLSWERDADGTLRPCYEQRVNRQMLPAHYVEAGAFLISRRDAVTPQGRIGERIVVRELPEHEAIDIDTAYDWVWAETKLREKHVVFRVDGHRQLGMGHAYRALGLAFDLTEHKVSFVCDSAHRDGIDLLSAYNMSVHVVDGAEGFYDWLHAAAPDIVVNDCLDTDAEYVQRLKTLVPRVITFEDLGDGTQYADAVVNDLYEGGEYPRHFYTGKDFVCLRDEFLIAEPKHFSEQVRSVFVMFGGSDPCNLTERIYDLAVRLRHKHPELEFTFVLGLGYGENPRVVDAPGIRIVRNCRRVSEYMRQADLAFTSQGRSTFELASLGVPAIVLAQNDRERQHVYAQMNNGFVNLGLGSEVPDEDIESTFEWLRSSSTIRKEMRELMLSSDLKRGARRVKAIILGEAL